ncbi:MAG: phosphoribosylanthranilate isomerase, partial [Desulfobulbales bacterium]
MESRTRIKVCGITLQEDARAAVAAGVDALGFIFVEQSPRVVDPDVVRAITMQLPPFVDSVGVFRDAEIEAVQELINYCKLTIVQLHGAESPEYCRNIPCRVIKSFAMRPGLTSEELSPFADVAGGFLLDTYHKGLTGGTGLSFDWELVEQIKVPGPLILAGGLTSDNVGTAIRRVKPFAV